MMVRENWTIKFQERIVTIAFKDTSLIPVGVWHVSIIDLKYFPIQNVSLIAAEWCKPCGCDNDGSESYDCNDDGTCSCKTGWRGSK